MISCYNYLNSFLLKYLGVVKMNLSTKILIGLALGIIAGLVLKVPASPRPGLVLWEQFS